MFNHPEFFFFLFWAFLSSCNQAGILHSKWIPMFAITVFVTILSIQSDDEYRDYTEACISKLYQCCY